MQHKLKGINQSLIESRRRNFRATCAILPGEYPQAAVRNKRLLQGFTSISQNHNRKKTQNYRNDRISLELNTQIAAWINENKSTDIVAKFPTYIPNI